MTSRFELLLIGFLLLHGKVALDGVVLQSLDTQAGYIARLLINDVLFPGDQRVPVLAAHPDRTKVLYTR